MPIVAFSFGSFGDVATVLQLAFQLRAALNDASGASAEVRTLVADFDQFTLAVQQAKAILEQPHSGLQPDVRTAITAALARCQEILLRVKLRIREFETRMTARLGYSAWRGYWAALAWEILGGKKEAEALRARLAEQVRLIQTYLAVSSCRDQDKLQTTARMQQCTLQRLCNAVENIQRYFGPEMPSFLFEDSKTGQLYQPLAQLSPEQCMGIGPRVHWTDEGKQSDFDWRDTKTAYPYRSTIQLGMACIPSYLETLVFKDNSGEIRVLIGLPPVWRTEGSTLTKILIGADQPRTNAPARAIERIATIYSGFVKHIKRRFPEKLDLHRFMCLLISTMPDPDYLVDVMDRIEPWKCYELGDEYGYWAGRTVFSGPQQWSSSGLNELMTALQTAPRSPMHLVSSDELRDNIKILETNHGPEIMVSPWVGANICEVWDDVRLFDLEMERRAKCRRYGTELDARLNDWWYVQKHVCQMPEQEACIIM